MNQPETYRCHLPLEPSSHLPPHPTPLGTHRALALGSLLHPANSHWLFILYMALYVSMLSWWLTQMVKNLPAMWQTWVWSLVWNDLLEKGIPWRSPWGCKEKARLRDQQTHTFPPTVRERSLFSTPSAALIACTFFDDGQSDWCKVIPHCSFDLLVSNNEQCWASFHVFISHLYVFFGEMSV